MRKTARAAALTASLATALSGGLMAAAGGAGAASASAGPGVHVINLQHARAAALAHGITLHKKIVMLPKGAHRARAQANGCTEPDCNLASGGGPVQHSPKVYLLLWGPSWGSGGTITDPAGQYMQSFLQGLGTPSDTWSLSTSQYTDSTGHPSFSGSVLAGTFQDTSTPPVQDQTTLAAEADAFATQQGISGNDAQIVVASQSGTQFADGFGTQYCAWHSSSSVPFTNMPYVADVGAGCGQNFVNSGSAGTYDGVSIVEGHEYAETVSDPFPTSGWYDGNDFVSGGENGDKCAWGGSNWGENTDPIGNITLGTGTFAVQSLWSNSAHSSGQEGCVMSSTATVYATNPVTVLTLIPRYTQISAFWSSAANATSYRVRVRSKSGTLLQTHTTTSPNYVVHNLQPLHTYQVAVRANPAAPGATIASVTTKTK
jgi:hypothetical protein